MTTVLPIPFALDPYVPAGVLPTLGGAEKGYLLNLLSCAWSALPPCRLPGPLEGLAIVAGAGPAEWAASALRVMRAFRAEPDGTYLAVELLAARNAMLDIRAKRAAAGRARGSKCSASAEQMLSKCSTAPVLEERARAERSESALAPLRSLRLVDSLSAPDSLSTGGSAGARAPGDQRPADEVSRVQARLQAMRFTWAEARYHTLPLSKVYELAALPWATEVLAAFVRARVEQEHPQRPLGWVFAAFGWDVRKRGWGRPWPIPVTFQLQWDASQRQALEIRRRIEEQQARVDAARAAAAARSEGTGS